MPDPISAWLRPSARPHKCMDKSSLLGSQVGNRVVRLLLSTPTTYPPPNYITPTHIPNPITAWLRPSARLPNLLFLSWPLQTATYHLPCPSSERECQNSFSHLRTQQAALIGLYNPVGHKLGRSHAEAMAERETSHPLLDLFCS